MAYLGPAWGPRYEIYKFIFQKKKKEILAFAFLFHSPNPGRQRRKLARDGPTAALRRAPPKNWHHKFRPFTWQLPICLPVEQRWGLAGTPLVYGGRSLWCSGINTHAFFSYTPFICTFIFLYHICWFCYLHTLVLQLVMHVFCTFMDLHIPPDPSAPTSTKPFTSKYFVMAPAKPGEFEVYFPRHMYTCCTYRHVGLLQAVRMCVGIT